MRSRVQIVLTISSTYLSIYASLPIFAAPAVAFLLPYSPASIADRARLPYKALFISYTSFLAALELILRCANAYNPGLMTWYSGSRTSFYILTPMLELLAIVPILLADLPHMFGDSNKAVLDAIHRFWHPTAAGAGAGASASPEASADADETKSSASEAHSFEKPSRTDAQASTPLQQIQQALAATTPNHRPGFWTLDLAHASAYGPAAQDRAAQLA